MEEFAGEAKRVEDIIDDLLELTRLEETGTDDEEIDVDRLVQGAVDKVRTFADTHRVEPLYLGQRLLQLFVSHAGVIANEVLDLRKLDRQVAVVVDGVDDGFANDRLPR